MLDPACEEWEEFPATSTAFAMLDGYGNHDHFVTDGYEGFSLRLYSPEEDLWRIWWSSTRRPGRLDPPVEGRFSADGSTARFETDDVLDGIPLRMRFDWSEITPTSARWDQSFSFDDGATWVRTGPCSSPAPRTTKTASPGRSNHIIGTPPQILSPTRRVGTLPLTAPRRTGLRRVGRAAPRGVGPRPRRG